MEIHLALLVIGGLFLLGLIADTVGRRTRIPRVTLLILLGVALGPIGFDLLPPDLRDWYEFLAVAALTMVAFVLGGGLTLDRLRAHGREILTISIVVVLISVLLVGAGLVLIGAPPVLALILGGVSTATAPAATADVVRQNEASGPFADRLLGIVAIDDAWGLIIFSLVLVLAGGLAGNGVENVLADALREIGGAIAVGVVVGLPSAALTGRLRPGEPMQIEALGVVFICAGLAIWLDVSFLLAGMIAGAIVGNFATHHERPIHEIEHVEWPFLVLFFVLAGASLEVGGLGGLWVLVVAYVALRLAGRVLGGWIGGRAAGLSAREGTLTGFALTPQAGVAVGMALVAGGHFPDLRETLLTIVISTTILFEIIGPLATQFALDRAGDDDTARRD